MPVVVLGKTPVAARLLRYTVKPKPDSSKERVLHAAGINCRVETSAREFAAHRRRHGKQGALRMSPARYELPDAGEVATHVRRTRPGGRRYWAVANDEEDATHVRREGELVKENEAIHFIVSFGLDEVNTEDPEQVARAFEGTVTMFQDLYPGLQMHLVGQADGAGMTPDPDSGQRQGKFHVHVVANAVVLQETEVDGRVWRPGSKMSGDLTNIDRVRERQDEWIAEHGVQLGMTQRLRPVREQQQERRSVMDRRMASRGELSNHDAIRAAFEEAMDDPRATDLDAFKTLMAEHGVEITEPGWRRGKAPKVRRISYRNDEMATPVRGASLGEHYMFEDSIDEQTGEVTMGVLSQLEANATGQPRQRRPEPQVAGAPRAMTVPTDDELAEARETITRLARDESLDLWLEDWAREEKVSVDVLLLGKGVTRNSPSDREVLHEWMERWVAESPTPTATTEVGGKAATQEQARQPDPAPKGTTFEELKKWQEANLVAQEAEAAREWQQTPDRIKASMKRGPAQPVTPPSGLPAVKEEEPPRRVTPTQSTTPAAAVRRRVEQDASQDHHVDEATDEEQVQESLAPPFEAPEPTHEQEAPPEVSPASSADGREERSRKTRQEQQRRVEQSTSEHAASEESRRKVVEDRKRRFPELRGVEVHKSSRPMFTDWGEQGEGDEDEPKP